MLPELRLDTLATGIPALTRPLAGMLMEACIWCLVECGHNNGVELLVTEDAQPDRAYSVVWPESKIDVAALYRAYNKDEGPEDGAVAIALLLIRDETEFTAIRRSISNTGIDYWLSYKGQFFQESARLEVSGILRAAPTNTIQRRMAQKLKQTQQSDDTSSLAYVVVVEFSHPMAEIKVRYVTA